MGPRLLKTLVGLLGGGLFLNTTVTLVLFLEQSLHCISKIRKRGSRRESLLSGHLGQDQVR